MTTLCRDCVALTIATGAAANAAHRAKSTMLHSIGCRSPMSIATPLMPRSRSATGRASPTVRSSSAAVSRGVVLAC